MVSKISKGIVNTINALHPSQNIPNESSFSMEGAGTMMTGENLKPEKKIRMMDDATFYQLYSTGEIGRAHV